MLFNSLEFPIFFLIIFTIYSLLRRRFRAQNVLLLVGSYVFYGWWDVRFLFLIDRHRLCRRTSPRQRRGHVEETVRRQQFRDRLRCPVSRARLGVCRFSSHRSSWPGRRQAVHRFSRARLFSRVMCRGRAAQRAGHVASKGRRTHEAQDSALCKCRRQPDHARVLQILRFLRRQFRLRVRAGDRKRTK